LQDHWSFCRRIGAYLPTSRRRCAENSSPASAQPGSHGGGCGEFAIDVATGTFTCEINARYTKSSCEHFEELSLDPDDRDGTTAQQAA